MNDRNVPIDEFLRRIDAYQKLLDTIGDQHIIDRIKRYRLRQWIDESLFYPYYTPISQVYGFHLLPDTYQVIEPPHVAIMDKLCRICIANMTRGMDTPFVLSHRVTRAIICQCIARRYRYRELVPCYDRLIYFLRHTYLEHASEEIGIHSRDGTDTEYNFRLQASTSVDVSPRYVYELGLRNVVCLSNKLELYRASQASPEQATPDDTIQDMPLYGCRVVDVYDEYLPPSTYISCDHHGILLRNSAYRIPVSIEYRHEILPGHHYEMSMNWIKYKDSDIFFMSQFPSYIEGWALYGECIGVGSDRDQVTVLESELLRDLRMMLDPAVHSSTCGRWTYEEVFLFLKYGIYHDRIYAPPFRGLAQSDSQINSEILRLISNPGDGPVYKIGKMFISHFISQTTDTLESIIQKILRLRVPMYLMQEYLSYTDIDLTGYNYQYNIRRIIDTPR